MYSSQSYQGLQNKLVSLYFYHHHVQFAEIQAFVDRGTVVLSN